MSDLPQLLEDAIPRLYLLNMIKYAGVASTTYLIADLFDTLEDEIILIWPSRLSPMKVVYLVNRYAVFIDSTLGLTVMLGSKTPQSCHAQWVALVSFYFFGSFASELILIIRTLAIWNFALSVMVLMGTISTAAMIWSLIIVQHYLRSMQYPSKELIAITGCVPSISDRIVWGLYASVLLIETTVIVLTLLKLSQSVRTTSSEYKPPPIVRTMYRDGIFFYAIMLSLSIANLCCMMLAPDPVSAVIQMPLRVVHSTLCSRVLLNLRRAALGVQTNDPTEISTLRAVRLETNPMYELTGMDQFRPGSPPRIELEIMYHQTYEARHI